MSSSTTSLPPYEMQETTPNAIKIIRGPQTAECSLDNVAHILEDNRPYPVCAPPWKIQCYRDLRAFASKPERSTTISRFLAQIDSVEKQKSTTDLEASTKPMKASKSINNCPDIATRNLIPSIASMVLGIAEVTSWLLFTPPENIYLFRAGNATLVMGLTHELCGITAFLLTCCWLGHPTMHARCRKSIHWPWFWSQVVLITWLTVLLYVGMTLITWKERQWWKEVKGIEV